VWCVLEGVGNWVFRCRKGESGGEGEIAVGVSSAKLEAEEKFLNWINAGGGSTGDLWFRRSLSPIHPAHLLHPFQPSCTSTLVRPSRCCTDT
jgi:hypothetical protein